MATWIESNLQFDSIWLKTPPLKSFMVEVEGWQGQIIGEVMRWTDIPIGVWYIIPNSTFVPYVPNFINENIIYSGDLGLNVFYIMAVILHMLFIYVWTVFFKLPLFIPSPLWCFQFSPLSLYLNYSKSLTTGPPASRLSPLCSRILMGRGRLKDNSGKEALCQLE